MSQTSHSPIATGIKFVKKANMWVFYIAYNSSKTADVHEWFATEEEAKARLEKEKNES